MTNISLAVALPLLAAFLLPVLGRVSTLISAVAGPLVLMLAALVLAAHWQVIGGDAFSVALGGFAPPLGIVFYVDGLSLLFALAVPLMTLLMWPWGRDRVREQTSGRVGGSRAGVPVVLEQVLAPGVMRRGQHAVDPVGVEGRVHAYAGIRSLFSAPGSDRTASR